MVYMMFLLLQASEMDMVWDNMWDIVGSINYTCFLYMLEQYTADRDTHTGRYQYVGMVYKMFGQNADTCGEFLRYDYASGALSSHLSHLNHLSLFFRLKHCSIRVMNLKRLLNEISG